MIASEVWRDVEIDDCRDVGGEWSVDALAVGGGRGVGGRSGRCRERRLESRHALMERCRDGPEAFSCRICGYAD